MANMMFSDSVVKHALKSQRRHFDDSVLGYSVSLMSSTHVLPLPQIPGQTVVADMCHATI